MKPHTIIFALGAAISLANIFRAVREDNEQALIFSALNLTVLAVLIVYTL